jgi:hypothetical protein
MDDTATWGVGESRELSDVLDEYQREEPRRAQLDEFTLADDFSFPLEFIYQVSFVTGMRGSGKSWTAGVLMEEFERLGLQFVCFDPLDAHGHLSTLDGIQKISPKLNESINCGKLVNQLKESNSSLIIDISNLTLEAQQDMVADYCESLIQAKMGKGLLTIFEECQDFVPLQKRNSATAPIIRLCKLGRALGYGVCMVTQRPAAITKEALSQASTYIIHNVMQTRDLIAIKDQISYGTDKERIDRLVDGIAFAQSGECIIYSPEFLKDDGFLWIGKITGDRRTEHKGKNIDVRPQKDIGMHTSYDIVESSLASAESDNTQFTNSFNTFSTEVAPKNTLESSAIPTTSRTDWMSPPSVESNLTWSPPVQVAKAETVEESNPHAFKFILASGFFVITAGVLALLNDE